jgi:multicomponent Na+:H+ antiporter subunit G
MTLLGLGGVAAMVVGGFFFVAGTAGVLRFPDVHSRLHAITKADNLGLGFVVLGLALHGGSVVVGLKLLVIWLLSLVASATSSILIAGSAADGSGVEQGESADG